VLSGRKSVAELQQLAPTMVGFDTEPAVLENVQILKVLHEISAETMQDILPPGLHPTIPPFVTWVVWQVGASPFGRFTIADCFFAPVVSRFRTYGAALPRASQDYAETIWAHPFMQEWLKGAEAEIADGRAG